MFKDIHILKEPVDLWTNCEGYNLLELSHSDPKKWGFIFQSYVMLTLLQNHKTKITKPIKLMERSIYSSRCFIEKMKREKLISDISYWVLDKYFLWMKESNYAPIDLIVYLRTSPMSISVQLPFLFSTLR